MVLESQQHSISFIYVTYVTDRSTNNNYSIIKVAPRDCKDLNEVHGSHKLEKMEQTNTLRFLHNKQIRLGSWGYRNRYVFVECHLLFVPYGDLQLLLRLGSNTHDNPISYCELTLVGFFEPSPAASNDWSRLNKFVSQSIHSRHTIVSLPSFVRT